MSIILQALSDEQLRAIGFDDVLLTAIPGSGKTRTLINKIIKEYSKEDSRMIVAITFTRRAADEVEDRVYNQLGYMPDNIWVGTIHKFCLDYIVRGYGSYSNRFSKNFEIISEPDQDSIKDELFKKYNINLFTPIDFTLDANGEPNDKKHSNLVNEYYNKIFLMNKIDFNYILYESYKILNIYPFIANQLSLIIKYILIDEYQDTQELQYQILAQLSHNKNLKFFIVGDSNQSIYDGIGGIVKTKNELDLTFNRNFIELHLSGCYRSNQKIIDFYKNFAINKIDMISLTEKWPNPTIKIEDSLRKNEVFTSIFNIIDKLILSGYNEKDIAIVAPQWHHLFEISNEIRKRFPNLQFDAPNLVPLKKDEDSIINKISRLLLTNLTYENLNSIKRLTKEILHQFEEDYGFHLKYNVNEFLNLVLKSRTLDIVGTIYLRNSLYNIFKSLDLLDYFKDNIKDFINGTNERLERYKTFGIEDDKIYFEQSLRSKKGIVISTIHAVKGEEYAVVIAFGLLEGYLPHWNDIINFGESVARERSQKLLFVICSRAKERLYLFAETDRKTARGNSYIINSDLKKVKEFLKY